MTKIDAKVWTDSQQVMIDEISVDIDLDSDSPNVYIRMATADEDNVYYAELTKAHAKILASALMQYAKMLP